MSQINDGGALLRSSSLHRLLKRVATNLSTEEWTTILGGLCHEPDSNFDLWRIARQSRASDNQAKRQHE